METDLTKRIKQLTHGSHPKINSKMRTIRWADEVWTPTGIVDSIRFEDYRARDEYMCLFLNHDRFSEKEIQLLQQMRPKDELSVCPKCGGKEMDSQRCHGCVWRRHSYEIGMMVTCFEVKITLSDFHSKNGHNFHGNENFYCVPKELAPKIEPLVPDDVGILAYYESKKQEGLRLYKPSGWRTVSDADKVYLLYNAMKKWCDGATFWSDLLQSEGGKK